MTVRKFAISLESSLADEIRESAVEAGTSVSGWLASAAAVKLQMEKLDRWLASYEREQGSFSDGELAAMEKAWQESR